MLVSIIKCNTIFFQKTYIHACMKFGPPPPTTQGACAQGSSKNIYVQNALKTAPESGNAL